MLFDMSAFTCTELPAERGAMLCDERWAGELDVAWFDFAHWQARGACEATPAGRGASAFVETPAGPMVLRHYRRGGLAARISRDRYLYTGAARTRSLAEFRLLAALFRAGQRVPRPLAALYRRHGLLYSAAILVERVPGARSLAELFDDADAALFRAVGVAVGTLHARQVWHADLNAHNVLVDPQGRVWLIDFDRARQRGGAGDPAWAMGNLARLRRSLFKLGAPERMREFEPAWRALLHGHSAALHGTTAGAA